MKKNIRVYVGGPITKGDYLVNVRMAVDAANDLRKAGLFPYVPHLHYEDWMEQDFEWILACQAMLRIPGESSGADREVAFCLEKGIPVFHSIPELLEWVNGLTS